ncbi:transcription factor RFX4 [Nematolebias whitei]|uniref:transcription factor RFX4 n=1 Tax=Nematolebias whitei TaxID=451745 RepID=UPI0018992799|nr:transcription factor RFX4 [Nematolebias whitei]
MKMMDVQTPPSSPLTDSDQIPDLILLCGPVRLHLVLPVRQVSAEYQQQCSCLRAERESPLPTVILNISRDGQRSRKQCETRGEPRRRGQRTPSHFLGRASVVDGKRMHCGLLEEPDMDSTGSFHLIHLMFDDYVLYLLESLHFQERANDLMKAMKGEGSPAEREQEFTLTETTPTSPSPGSYSPARSVQSVDVSSASSPTAALSPEYTGVTTSTGAVQSYTWSLTYTVTTAGGATPETGQQLSCMRSSPPVPPPSSTHRMPVYREEYGYTGSYNYGSYTNQHPHSIQSQYQSLGHDPAIPAPLHYSAYHRSSAQYQLNGQMSRMEPCLMGSTPRLHPTPVAPRWPDVSPTNSCYTSPPLHSSRYATSGDMYSPLGPRRNSDYEHSQHFPGFAYINGEATTGWAK